MTSLNASARQHRDAALSRGPVSVAIVTVSDTRSPASDVNAAFLREAITAAGHVVSDYRLIKDDPHLVEQTLEDLARGEASILLFNGGTGLSRRDNTFDAISRKLEKSMPGFGEIFRMLSYEQVGAAAMLSRATAGVFRGRVVFSMPGSPAAVRLAWEKLIEPELAHLAWEVVR